MPSRTRSMVVVAAIFATGATFALAIIAFRTLIHWLDTDPIAATTLRVMGIAGVIVPPYVIYLRRIRRPGS